MRHATLEAARAKLLGGPARDYQLYLHRIRLWHGSVDLAVQGLRDLRTGLPDEALKPVQEAIRYLEHQRGWIGPMSSGANLAIQSAVR